MIDIAAVIIYFIKAQASTHRSIRAALGAWSLDTYEKLKTSKLKTLKLLLNLK